MNIKHSFVRTTSLAITALAVLGPNPTLQAQSCFNMQEGLISWWQAEDNGSDSTGANPADPLPCYAYDAGKKGHAFGFYGANQIVRIPNSPSLNPSNSLTVEAWVYVSDHSLNDSVVIIGKDDHYTWHQYMLGLTNANGRWIFQANLAVAEGYKGIQGVTEVLPRTWYHAAMTYDGQELRLYANGALESRIPLTGPIPPTPNPLLFGGHATGPWGLFGRIDEASLHGRALSPREIAGIYNAGTLGKCPLPAPAITLQPTSQTVSQGDAVLFTAQATGYAPLSFQWRFEGADIAGATNPTLLLSNALPSMSGIYSIAVNSPGGMASSSNAVLTVLGSECVSLPQGVAGWWKGDGNAEDSAGTNNGTTGGGLTYTRGLIGNGFTFDGTSGFVRITATTNLDVGRGAGLTIEAWINPADVGKGHPVVEWAGPAGTSGYGAHLWIGHPSRPQGYFLANLVDTNGNWHLIDSLPGAISTNRLQHVAVAYDKTSGLARLFLDGTVVSEVNLGIFTPRTSQDLYIGKQAAAPSYFFDGLIDEVGVYNRALSPAEIKSICLARSFGKCPIVVAPAITSHPAAQTVDEGTTLTLAVQATGSTPLSYQWLLENAVIQGATNSVLILSNTLPAMSGNYSVAVANSGGRILSSNALVTILAQPTICVSAPAGIVGWWTAEGNTSDVVNSSTTIGTASYTTGRVGRAFSMNGTTHGLTAAASSNLAVQSLTIEAWVNPADSSVNPHPIVEYAAATGHSSIALWHNIMPGPVGFPGALYALIRGTNGTWLEVSSPGGLLPTNKWSHVALTFDYATHTAQIYLNGTIVAANTTTNLVQPNTYLPVNIGVRPPGSAELLAGRRFVGKLDEVAIYNRTLSSGEIRNIYRTGSFGKCPIVVAPSITSQPASQTVDEGTTVSLAVQATGSAPLSYQWLFANNAIPGATNSVLVLSNTLPSMSGIYAVAVGNSGGSAISSNALLTIVALPTTCVTAPAGLVGWWKGQDNGQDSAGTNHATIGGGLSFAAGKVDRAFVYNGTGSFVSIPASSSTDVGTNDGFTTEAWIKPANTISLPIFEWSPDGAYGVLLYANQPTLGTLMASIVDLGGGQHVLQTASGTLKPDILQHVALTYDKASGIARLFLDGRVVVQSTVGSFTPKTDRDLQIGYRLPGAPYGEGSFSGLIDEASLYNRALLTNEVLSIYRARGFGKCPSAPVIPSITTQPAGVTINAGDVAIFAVQAAGSAPLSYQWQFGTTNIPGATMASLVLSNVQPSNAGPYSVMVSNPAGSALSSNALLVVLSPTNTCITPPAGLVGWWPGDRSGTDLVFGNNAISLGVFAPTYGYTGGKVGEAFDLATTLGLVVPASTNLAIEDLTIEAWINPNSTDQPSPVVEYGGSNTLASVSLWQSMAPGGLPNPGALYGVIRNIGGGGLEISTLPGLFRSNAWTHVALTFDHTTRTAQIFVNGVVVATNTSPTPIRPDTSLPVNIGYRQIATAELLGGFRFRGGMDEVSIYNRALSGGELLSIHAAGSAGKCHPPHIGTAIVPPRRVSGGFNLSFRGDVGRPLQVQRADSLTGPWLPLGTVFIDGTGFGNFSDTNAPEVKAFYRTAQ